MPRINKTTRVRAEPPRREPLIVSTKAAGQMLGDQTPGKIRALCRAGLLDYVMLGGAYFPKVESVYRLAAEGEAPPHATTPRGKARVQRRPEPRRARAVVRTQEAATA